MQIFYAKIFYINTNVHDIHVVVTKTDFSKESTTLDVHLVFIVQLNALLCLLYKRIMSGIHYITCFYFEISVPVYNDV